VPATGSSRSFSCLSVAAGVRALHARARRDVADCGPAIVSLTAFLGSAVDEPCTNGKTSPTHALRCILRLLESRAS
jgi:hypothetical protein